MPKVYLPHVSTHPRPERCLAAAYPEASDLARLGVDWYYVWGFDPGRLADPRYIPMSFYGQPIPLPAGYAGYLLVYNEPTLEAPYGCALEPAEAAARIRVLQALFPAARLVVGNVPSWDASWLVDLSARLETPPCAWGIHLYAGAVVEPVHLLTCLLEAYQALGGCWWVTEYADTLGRLEAVEELRAGLQALSFVEKAFYFTNRAKGDEVWYPPPWRVQLQDFDTRELTDLGAWFAGEAGC